MKKTYFIPKAEETRLTWITNFNLKLFFYAKALGILAPALLIVLNDTNAFTYIMALKAAVKKFGLSVTTFLNTLSNSSPETALAVYPVLAPIAGGAPLAVPVGIFPRCAILVKQIKASGLCTDAMALDLGIVGTDIDPKFATAQPSLKMSIIAGKPSGKYIRKQADGVHIERKRGAETAFSYLLTANKSTFVDNSPNLVAGQAETREYRAWFIVNDEVVGIVSLVFSITVTG